MKHFTKKLLIAGTLLLFTLILLTGCLNKDPYEDTQDIDLADYQEDVAMYINSGFFYTSTLDYQDEDVTDYFNNRRDSVELFMDFINDSVEAAIRTNDGLLVYEEAVLNYMDQVDMDSSETDEMIEEIFSYRLLIDTAI